MRAAALVVVLVLLPWRAIAATCSEAVPVEEGLVAPCSGLLVPPDEATQAIECLRLRLPECRSRGELDRARLSADLEAQRKIAEIERSRAEVLSRELDKAARTIDPPPLWKHPAIWGSVGLVVGSFATVYLITRIDPPR